MWLNIKTMPLQTLADKVAKSKALSRIGWRIEDEETNKARFVYDVIVGRTGSVSTVEVSFKEICEMFEWKKFTIHPSRQTIDIEHTAKHLNDMES